MTVMGKIKNITMVPVVIASMLLGTSCGSEDELVSEYHDPSDFFVPDEDATDETSQLRRSFYEQYGSYLLFSDTLQHRLLGKNINGDDVYMTETIDIAYNVGQSTSGGNKYSYTYLYDIAQQKAAVEYLERFILSHLSKQMKPFSWFLAGNITAKTNSGNTLRPYAVIGQRCFALALAQLNSLHTDAQKQMLANRQLVIVLGGLVNNHIDRFSDFFAVSGSSYGTYFGSGLTAAERRELLYSHGFTSASGSSGDNYYPKQNEDLNAFATIAVNYTDESISRQYGDYPLIMQKIRIMKNTLEELGYIF